MKFSEHKPWLYE